MKLATKFAGMLGTGAFILVCLTVYLSAIDPAEWIASVGAALNYIFEFATGGNPSPESAQLPVSISLSNPLKAIQWGLVGAVAGGFLGYHLGFTMDHPKGRKPSPKKLAEPEPAPQLANDAEKAGSKTGSPDKLDGLIDEAVSALGEGTAAPEGA